MKYELPSTKPSLSVLASGIFLFLVFIAELVLNVIQGWPAWIIGLCAVVLFFGATNMAYAIFFCRYPAGIETTDDSAVIFYDRGGSERIPYVSIQRARMMKAPGGRERVGLIVEKSEGKGVRLRSIVVMEGGTAQKIIDEILGRLGKNAKSQTKS